MSLVKADVRVVKPADADGTAETAITIDPAEPVFAGHYPNYPIFPGVCVVDSVHRGALATAPAAVALASVESARFLGAVLPGDVLRMDLKWTRDGNDWLCGGKAHTGRGAAASVKLRYRAVS
jgi:3-hydroxyacyl-[acyl-carrier-protein] dehydratase